MAGFDDFDSGFETPEEASAPALRTKLRGEENPEETAPSLAEAINAPRPSVAAPRTREGGPRTYADINASRQEVIAKNPPPSADQVAAGLRSLTESERQAVGNTDSYRKLEDIKTGLESQMKNTRDLMRTKEQQTAWFSALESIGQAMTQYAAARYGLEHGVNLAGLKQQKTDWQGMLANAQNRLESELRDLQGLRKEAAGEQREMGTRAESQAQFAYGQQIAGAREKQAAEERALESETRERQHREQLDATLAAASMRAGLGQAKTARDTELHASAVELKNAQETDKQAKLALGTLANLQANPNQKIEDKDKELLAKELSSAGVPMADVQGEKGALWWKHKEIDLDKAAAELTKKIAANKASMEAIRDHAANVAAAKSDEEVRLLRQARPGMNSPSAAQASAPLAPPQSTPPASGPKPGDIVTQGGVRYQFDGTNYNPLPK